MQPYINHIAYSTLQDKLDKWLLDNWPKVSGLLKADCLEEIALIQMPNCFNELFTKLDTGEFTTGTYTKPTERQFWDSKLPNVKMSFFDTTPFLGATIELINTKTPPFKHTYTVTVSPRLYCSLVIDWPEAHSPWLIKFTEQRDAAGDNESETCIIIHKDDIDLFAKATLLVSELSEQHNNVQNKTITVVKGNNVNSTITINRESFTTWDDVFVTDPVKHQVKDDVDFFINNKTFFDNNKIPYKRGYLLCGPPGCGKTMICRTLATSLPFYCLMFDFSDPRATDSDLETAFKTLKDRAPGIFFMEDIDRIFEPNKCKTNITLSTLLNCLDGISPNVATIIVATANNPKIIDEAILKRPGRFDRVVKIDLPDSELRHRYLTRLFQYTKVSKNELLRLTKASEGLSMAFLKEVFVAAATHASMESGSLNIVDEDAKVGFEQIKNQFEDVSSASSRKAGF